MFESEVKWFNMHTDKDSVASNNFLDTLHKQIEDAINGAKNIDVSPSLHQNGFINRVHNLPLIFLQIDYKRYTRSPILSNNVIYYPTSSGFPIKLSTDVNSVINFKMNGNVDIPKIINRPKSADVRLQIVPRCVNWLTFYDQSLQLFLTPSFVS